MCDLLRHRIRLKVNTVSEGGGSKPASEVAAEAESGPYGRICGDHRAELAPIPPITNRSSILRLRHREEAVRKTRWSVTFTIAGPGLSRFEFLRVNRPADLTQ
jgi:hypothetical protein